MDVVVGRIAKAHGITGELAVDLHTDSPSVRFAVGATVVARLKDKSTRTLTVAAARPHSGRLLVRFAEVPDRDTAEVVRGSLLLADTADLPPTEDPDEFYDHELTGLAVLTPDGTALGTVREVLHGAGTDMLAIDRAGGGELLVPFVQAIVTEVDVPGRRVVVNPPDGLLDL